MASPVHQEMNLLLLAALTLWLCHLLTKRWTHHCNQHWHGGVICRHRPTHHSYRNHTQRPADRQWWVIRRQPTHHWHNHRTDRQTDSHLLAHSAIHPPLLSASLTSTELVSWAELTVSTSIDSTPDWLASTSSSTDDCTPRVHEGFEGQNSRGFEWFPATFFHVIFKDLIKREKIQHGKKTRLLQEQSTTVLK